MRTTTLLLITLLVIGFGTARASNDTEIPITEVASPTLNNEGTSPVPDNKEFFYMPAPEPEPQLPTCATPRDGSDSVDEGDRVMCDNSAPQPTESQVP